MKVCIIKLQIERIWIHIFYFTVNFLVMITNGLDAIYWMERLFNGRDVISISSDRISIMACFL